MSRETIRDWTGKIIGFIETDFKGNKIARDFYGKIVGKYDKQFDVTRDFYGRLVGRGDQTVGTIWKHKV